MGNYEFKLPKNFVDGSLQLTGTRNEAYEPASTAQEIYNFLRKLPSDTVGELEILIREKPLFPFRKREISR